jgi:hypothetical protein
MMPLADEIQELGNRSRSDLDELYDYYEHTKIAWRVVQLYVKDGRKFKVNNRATGTAFDEASLLGRSQKYITNNLAVSTFKQITTYFEDYYFGLQRIWLSYEPRPLSDMPVTFGDVLKAGSIDSLKTDLIHKRLHRKSYDSVSDWFKDGEKLMNLGRPTVDQIAKLAEMKASRDVLEHRRGIVDPTYRFKAGIRSRDVIDGDRVEVPEYYLRDSWTLVKTVTNEITTAAQVKATP